MGDDIQNEEGATPVERVGADTYSFFNESAGFTSRSCIFCDAPRDSKSSPPNSPGLWVCSPCKSKNRSAPLSNFEGISREVIGQEQLFELTLEGGGEDDLMAGEVEDEECDVLGGGRGSGGGCGGTLSSSDDEEGDLSPDDSSTSDCFCHSCITKRQLEMDCERETFELQQCWNDLRDAVRYIYRQAVTSAICDSVKLVIPDNKKLSELVKRLCLRDSHLLFKRLEGQATEYVVEVKVRLLKQLTSGHKTPRHALDFTDMLLSEFDSLLQASERMTEFLKYLITHHLCHFRLSWALHNQHLFHSIVYTEPLIQNSLNMLLSQLRAGCDGCETYKPEKYHAVWKRFMKLSDEMNVVSVVWRDCQILIDKFQEERENMKVKKKMLKEGWDHFTKERKLWDAQMLGGLRDMNYFNTCTHHNTLPPNPFLLANSSASSSGSADSCASAAQNVSACNCSCNSCSKTSDNCDTGLSTLVSHTNLLSSQLSSFPLQIKPPSIPSTGSDESGDEDVVPIEIVRPSTTPIDYCMHKAMRDKKRLLKSLHLHTSKKSSPSTKVDLTAKSHSVPSKCECTVCKPIQLPPPDTESFHPKSRPNRPDDCQCHFCNLEETSETKLDILLTQGNLNIPAFLNDFNIDEDRCNIKTLQSLAAAANGSNSSKKHLNSNSILSSGLSRNILPVNLNQCVKPDCRSSTNKNASCPYFVSNQKSSAHTPSTNHCDANQASHPNPPTSCHQQNSGCQNGTTKKNKKKLKNVSGPSPEVQDHRMYQWESLFEKIYTSVKIFDDAQKNAAAVGNLNDLNDYVRPKFPAATPPHSKCLQQKNTKPMPQEPTSNCAQLKNRRGDETSTAHNNKRPVPPKSKTKCDSGTGQEASLPSPLQPNGVSSGPKKNVTGASLGQRQRPVVNTTGGKKGENNSHLANSPSSGGSLNDKGVHCPPQLPHNPSTGLSGDNRTNSTHHANHTAEDSDEGIIEDNDLDDDGDYLVNDSDDETASMRSNSTTSGSSIQCTGANGKKTADCCYCELMGHNNQNLVHNFEIKAKLRQKLEENKKKKETEEPPVQAAPSEGQLYGIYEDIDELAAYIEGSAGSNQKKRTKKAKKKKKTKQNSDLNEDGEDSSKSLSSTHNGSISNNCPVQNSLQNGIDKVQSSADNSRPPSIATKLPLEVKSTNSNAAVVKNIKANPPSVPEALNQLNPKESVSTNGKQYPGVSINPKKGQQTSVLRGDKSVQSANSSEQNQRPISNGQKAPSIAPAPSSSGKQQQQSLPDSSSHKIKSPSVKPKPPATSTLGAGQQTDNRSLPDHQATAAPPVSSHNFFEALNNSAVLSSVQQPSSGTTPEVVRKKKKRNKKNGKQIDGVLDEVFKPKEDIDGLDEDEKELELFKRFCMATPTSERPKIKLDLQDILKKTL